MESRRSPILQVSEGLVQGVETSSVSGKKFYSFEGIPYAQPPVGSLRFKDPKPPQPWSGVLDASRPGNRCAQIEPLRPKRIDGSEDCLFLNVYTPAVAVTPVAPLPVIVFAHGGRLLVGYGDYYRPDYLLDQDVVVVTFNYRVGVLGFLCLDIPEVPGNAGHKDVILALRWLQKNIHNFQGDTKNITFMGESAGASIASALLTSPMANGLINKVIMESGTSLHDRYIYPEDYIANANEIAKEIGDKKTDPYMLLEYLQKADLKSLLHALYNVERNKKVAKSVFTAVIEKKFDGVENFLTEEPRVSFAKGIFQRIPTLIGYSNIEGAYFVKKDRKGNVDYNFDLRALIPNFLGIDLRSNKAINYAEELREFYFRGELMNELTLSNFVDLLSDHLFIREIYRLVEILINGGNEVYFYQFSYKGSAAHSFVKNKGLNGATHTDILAYQFYKANRAFNTQDKEIVKFLAESWTNFAKSGKPMSNDEWLPATENHIYCIDINTQVKLLEDPLKERMRFCLKMLNKYKHDKSRL